MGYLDLVSDLLADFFAIGDFVATISTASDIIFFGVTFDQALVG